MKLSRRWWLALLAITIAAALWSTGLFDALTLDNLQLQESQLAAHYRAAPVRFSVAYFTLYVLVTGLSLPGAVIMTLAGGAVFGLGLGTLLVSFASTVGATLAFGLSRSLFRSTLERRFATRLATINRGLEREGALYLLSLRLIPLFPFFVVNACLGLTRIPPWRFAVISQIGMLPGTVAYVNAGAELSRLEGPGDVLSLSLLGAFAVLALLPWVARLILGRWRSHRRYAGFQRPRHFDANLVVIGAGAAGLVTAYLAAALKARVILIERDAMGGDCLNHGCVPSKALIAAAARARAARQPDHLGIRTALLQVDFPSVMRHVHAAIAQIAPNDAIERYESLGVNCVQGSARIVSPWEVEVGDQRIAARHIVLATGARPRRIDIPGLPADRQLTSDTLWTLQTLPQRLVVVGGGPIGCELAQAFAALGTEVTLIQRGPELLPREDPEVGRYLAAVLRAEGIDLRLNHIPVSVKTIASELALTIAPHPTCSGSDASTTLADTDAPEPIRFDYLLCATGRDANTEDLGLEALGIVVRPDGTIETDDCLQTSMPNILACGDVTGPMQFTHAAAHQAGYAALNALFRNPFKRFRVDYRAVPWCTFTRPEVASVGLNETRAAAAGIPYELVTLDMADLDRAVTEAGGGLIRVLLRPGSDQIIGATIASPMAGEILAQFVLAMQHKLGLSALLRTVYAYPTWSEGVKRLAGQWRQTRTPNWQLTLLRRWHAWRR